MQVRSREHLISSTILIVLGLIGVVWLLQDPDVDLGGSSQEQSSEERLPVVAGPAGDDAGASRSSVDDPIARVHPVRVIHDIDVGVISVVAVREDGESTYSEVKLPGEIQIPAEGDWMAVLRGESICPQLVMLREPADSQAIGEDVWVVPSGSAQVSIREPSGIPWDSDEQVGATIRVNACPDDFPDQAKGLILGSSQLSRLSTASLSDLQEFFADGVGEANRADLSHLLLAAVRDERVELLSSTSLRSTLEVAEFDFEVSGGSTAVRAGLPAGVTCSWRIYRDGAFEVLPRAAQSHVDPSGDGFVRKIGHGFRQVWSAGFLVPEKGSVDLSAVVYEESGIQGVLDLAALPQAAAASRVAIFSRFEQHDANGKLLVTYDAEGVVYPDEQGVFAVKGLLPGWKRIAAIWRDENGTICVASRIFELPVDQVVDLGLIQPTRSQPVRLRFDLVDEGTSQPMPWSEVFGDAPQGEVTVILKNSAKAPSPEDDFWEALYPKVGTEITVLGLSPSEWHVTVMAGGAESDWPNPQSGLSVDRRMRELLIDSRQAVDESVAFAVAEQTALQLQVAVPPGTDLRELGRALNLNALVFTQGDGDRQKMTLRFEQSLGGYFSELPARFAPAFVVLGGLPSSEEPLLGTFELSEADAQSGQSLRVELSRGHWVEAGVPSDWVERMRTGVLMLDVDSWPATSKAHFIGILDSSNRVRFGPVPDGALVTERTLGLFGVVRDGQLVIHQN